MVDPLAPETLRLVGNRTRLATARRIADDIAANGPATYAELARRTGLDGRTITRTCDRMIQACWGYLDHGVFHLEAIADPFPRDL